MAAPAPRPPAAPPSGAGPTGPLLEAQAHVLELIVRGSPLPDVLASLCRIAEAQADRPVRAAILLVDAGGKRLVTGAAPSLPDEYNRAIDGIAIAPDVGTCCAAAACREVVVTPDIAAAPGWAAFAHLPLGLGLRAAWSMPIVSAGGVVLGTFGTYFPERREPTPDERRLVEVLSRTAALAVERHRSDELLRASEERFRSVFEAMNEGFCLVEPVFDAAGRAVDYRYLMANPAIEHHMGLKDVVGRTAREVMPHHETHWVEAYARVAATGETFRGEGQVEDLGRWFEVSAFRVGDPALGHVGILFSDASDRHRADEALRDADRRKDEFLALLAHELRNPLAPLRNGLQVMRLAGANTDAADRARGMMERQLGHMVRLIDDLLDVSRIGRGKMELRRERVLLAEVIANAVETARPAVDAGGHAFEASLPTEPVYLDADLTRLAQVFSNLLTNSAKYTPNPGAIRLTAERAPGAVVVRVRDTGVGIPAEALPRIFDMFSQVDRSIERTTGGLGIGLALVKGLVEMHGGSVGAESGGSGAGSTFTVVLPLAPGQPPVPEAGPSRDGVPSGGPSRRVLVVDDNRDSASSMATMLEILGHDVRTAHDGLEAVAAAEAFRPEVILMDVGMPRLNGYEATRRIRGQAWGKAATVVALTGWGQEGDRAQSQDAGCTGHLVKPVDLADLLPYLE